MIGRNTHLDGIAVLPDDRIRITGPFDNTTNYRLYVIGLTANGGWDGSWASNGLYIDPAVNRGNGLLLQADGKLLVAGSDQVSFSLRDDYVVMRMDTNGVLDNSWDGDGVAIVDMAGNNDNLRAVFQLSNGKVLGVGSVRDDNSNRFIGLIRLNNSGTLPCIGVQTNATQWICSGDSAYIHGQWRTASGNYPQTYTAQNGCDSTHSVQLQLYPAQQINQVHSACGSFTWIDGITYTQSTNGPHWTLTNQQGCDSIVRLDLSIFTVDTSLQQNGAVLNATGQADAWQWINCITEMPIIGAVSSQYMPVQNGQYAVVITYQGCSDTSRCVTINGIGVNHFKHPMLRVYPNPHRGEVQLELPPNYQHYRVEIIDLLGRILETKQINDRLTPKIMLPKHQTLLLRVWGDSDYLGTQLLKAK